MTEMDETILISVKKVIEAQKSVSEAFDKLEEVLGVRSDSEFFNTYWKAIELCIEAVSIAVGDEQDWISWYIYDNEYGKKKMKAGYDGKLKKIGAIKDLVKLIEEGKKK